MLIQYVRNGKGQKAGALVAKTNVAGHIIIGHSKWAKSMDDYDSTMALRVAKDRADKDSKVAPALSILTKYNKFISRAQKYYKNCALSANTLCAIAIAEAKHRACKKNNQRLLAAVEEASQAKTSTIELGE